MFWGDHAWGVGPLDVCPRKAAVDEALVDAPLGP
jgi:hypothetical protein